MLSLRSRRVGSFDGMSERPSSAAVALRERSSGRYLATGATWSADVVDAIVLEELEAREVVRRFACEPEAVELVAAALVNAA